MMINFGSLVQIGIRDNTLKLCEKERKKKNFFSLWGQMRVRKKSKKKENVFLLNLYNFVKRLRVRVRIDRTAFLECYRTL